MKKIVTLVLTVIMVGGLLTLSFNAEENEGTITINVYNWGQYIGDGTDDTIDVNKEFTERTGIKVNYSTYDDNESLLAKLEMGGANYDVIIPSDYMIEKLIEKDMLEKINFDNIPNFQYIDDTFKNPLYDPKNEYSVPYTFGTVGIIYNTKYVTKEVDSWNILWDEEYKDKILMFSNPRDAFGIAQFLLGIDVNTTNTEDFDKCYDKLKEQKPVIQNYVMDQIFEAMPRTDAWIAPYYAGDYITMVQDNEDLAFAYPKEGYNYFVDAICIPKGAEHKEAAEAYINFLCDPEIAGQNSEAIGYAVPISEAKQYMSEEYAENEIMYPPAEVIEKGELFRNLPDDTMQYMNKLWTDVRSNNNFTWVFYVIGGVLIVALVAALSINRARKKKLYADQEDKTSKNQ